MKFLIAMIDAGGNVNAPASYLNQTPVHVAAEDGSYELVKMLLEAGAKMNVVNSNGATPLSLATQNKHDNIVAMLKSAGAK